MAGVDAKEVDLILLCTSSPEDAFGGACLVRCAPKKSLLSQLCHATDTIPPGSPVRGPARSCALRTCPILFPFRRVRPPHHLQVQAALGASNAAAFDLTAACSGFVLGVVSAVQYVRGGAMKNVLVIGADALSRHVDWRDRGTCILFGDGCGAVLIQARHCSALARAHGGPVPLKSCQPPHSCDVCELAVDSYPGLGDGTRDAVSTRTSSLSDF